jgi:peptide/nickel transport system ATP-binding protein
VVTGALHGPALLEVRHLVTRFHSRTSSLTAVDDVSLSVPRGQAVGLVGESGSGKSVTALSILRLLREPPAEVAGGEILFEGRDLRQLSERELERIRGARISMVFQEPMTSLNPVHTVGDQVGEPLRIHRGASKKAARRAAVELLAKVRIADPERRANEYPHQMSGGMRQRAMIAMALACEPDLLIADEPTTALDVTIQAQILELLRHFRRENGLSLLLITHDLGVVAEVCDRVVVMYAGRVFEEATVGELFTSPLHPYTTGLLRSTLGKSFDAHAGRKSRRLIEIPGLVPRLDRLPPGCRFAERCPKVESRCRHEEPSLLQITDGHRVRCFYPEEERVVAS